MQDVPESERVIVDGQEVHDFWSQCFLLGEDGTDENRQLFVKYKDGYYIFSVCFGGVSSTDEYLSNFMRERRVPYEGDVCDFNLDLVARPMSREEGYRRWSFWLLYRNAFATKVAEAKRGGWYDPEMEEYWGDMLLPWLYKTGLIGLDEAKRHDPIGFECVFPLTEYPWGNHV